MPIPEVLESRRLGRIGDGRPEGEDLEDPLRGCRGQLDNVRDARELADGP